MVTRTMKAMALASGLIATLLGHSAYTQTAASATPSAVPKPASPPPRPAPAPTRPPPTVDANHVLRLYTDGFAASYLPVPGFAPVNMPVRDATDGATGSGCYIACSSHKRRGSIYAPDPNTFVVGAVRIMGNYQGGVCHPGGQEHVDLASDSRLSELCALAMPKVCETKHCFANGDTGTWVPPSQTASAPGGAVAHSSGEESCVLACYSHDGDGALYQVSSEVFAIGGFQTGGRYVESVCKPRDFDGDLGSDPAFKHHCTELFPKQCANDVCWANGDTRGRLGGN